MAPGSPSSRRFRRVAEQRLAHAEFLLKHLPDSGQTVVYLAGYCVECALKALILSRVPRDREGEVIDTFKGRAAHDLEYLRQQYYREGGERMPREIVTHFTRASTWRVDMRYEPGIIKNVDARRFLDSVIEILKWAERRL